MEALDASENLVLSKLFDWLDQQKLGSTVDVGWTICIQGNGGGGLDWTGVRC